MANSDTWRWDCPFCGEEYTVTRGFLTEEQEDEKIKCENCKREFQGGGLIGTKLPLRYY